MSARKKTRRPGAGRSHRKGRSRGALRRLLAPLVLVAVVLSAVAVGGVLVLVTGRDGGPPPPIPNTAVIVDHLSLTAPSPQFVESATDTLEKAGYTVDYYPGEEITVDFYRDLQTRGYELIVFRTHSSRITGEWRGEVFDETVFHTSEPYDQAKYVDEQRDMSLGQVYAREDGPRYFGVGAGFVRSSMRGNFDGSTVIMMGCNGLFTDTTARAFLDRGAEAVISWDSDVSASHTDVATERLLELLVAEGLTPEEAVAQTAAELGPDPSFEAELRVLTSEG